MSFIMIEESEKVEELLEELKIDEFERLYISVATQSNSPNKEQISDEKLKDIKTLAEFQLEQRSKEEEVSISEKERLKTASNYYLIPHTVNQRYSVGNSEQNKEIDLYTINDVEGYSLYSIINQDNISMSIGFRNEIQAYLEKNYQEEINDGRLSIDEVIDFFSPSSIEELYEMLSNDSAVSMRFLPDRIDEFVITKGIEPKQLLYKPQKIKETDFENRDNLLEENQIQDDDINEDQRDNKDDIYENELSVRETEEEKKEKGKEKNKKPIKKYESYIEEIARFNHVSPSVVNIRVIENFEKVEEDTGIKLRGRYPRGEVVAVRLPYKLGYRTFLADKRTGITIDGKGRTDRKTGRLYDFDEIEDYFRFKPRAGKDGGEAGKPLRYDERRDYTTYINPNGNLDTKKYINNGKEQDMHREERERYLAEVEEVDEQLALAIDTYQKYSTHENYEAVRKLVEKKVSIDNKYNALHEQREVTKETIENAENAIQRDLDDDDDWFPGGRYHR